jgi:hypothetical protein
MKLNKKNIDWKKIVEKKKQSKVLFQWIVFCDGYSKTPSSFSL